MLGMVARTVYCGKEKKQRPVQQVGAQKEVFRRGCFGESGSVENRLKAEKS